MLLPFYYGALSCKSKRTLNRSTCLLKETCKPSLLKLFRSKGSSQTHCKFQRSAHFVSTRQDLDDPSQTLQFDRSNRSRSTRRTRTNGYVHSLGPQSLP